MKDNDGLSNTTILPDDLFKLFNQIVQNNVDTTIINKFSEILEIQYGKFLSTLITKEWEKMSHQDHITELEGEHGRSLGLIIENASQKEQLKVMNKLLTEEIRIRKIKEEENKKITKELENLNDKLKDLTLVDPLTGVRNRRHFNQIINVEWNRAIRFRYPISILMIDIDFFKQYNDTYGHLNGDKCIKEVAIVLSKEVKHAGDFFARYGGEEFIAVLADTDAKGALVVAQRMKTSILRLEIPHKKSEISDFVTVSIGVSSMLPQERSVYKDMITKADEALYDAKKSGRNKIVVIE